MKSNIKNYIIVAAAIIFTIAAIRLPAIYAENRVNQACDAAQPGVSLKELSMRLDALGYQITAKDTKNDWFLISFSTPFIEKFTCVIRVSAGKILSAEVNRTD